MRKEKEEAEGMEKGSKEKKEEFFFFLNYLPKTKKKKNLQKIFKNDQKIIIKKTIAFCFHFLIYLFMNSPVFCVLFCESEAKHFCQT